LKILVAALFISMGCLFLLVSTIFYPDTARILLSWEARIGTPDFWNLTVVLNIVRIIFIIVGFFLTIFGIASLWLKKFIW
jgi:hypothetical protein